MIDRTLLVSRHGLDKPVGGQYLHPAFQFLLESGETHPKLNALLAKLPDEDHGWVAAFWLFAPTRKLDGARPADICQGNPTR